jgi:hypothetical protein
MTFDGSLTPGSPDGYVNLKLALNRGEVQLTMGSVVILNGDQLRVYLDSMIATADAQDITITSYTELAWTQPVWDIDPINGNDNNTGLEGQPIKTFLEQHRRVGRHEVDSVMSSQTPKVKVLIRSSLLPTDKMVIDLTFRSLPDYPFDNSYIPYQILGTPQKVNGANGTITNVRSYNAGLNRTWGITTSTNLASHIIPGRYLQRTNVVTAFPNRWWVAADEGGGVYRVSYPTHFASDDIVNGANDGTFSINDTYDVYDLPVIGAHDIRTSQPVVQSMLINKLRFSGLGIQAAGQIVFTECAFDNSVFYGDWATFSNCQMNGLVTASRKTYTYYAFGLFLNTTRIWIGQPTFQNYVMFQGGMSLPTDGGVDFHCHTRGFQVFDQDGDGFTLNSNDTLLLNGGIIGSGNSGYGWNIERGASMILNGGLMKAVGALGDFMVGGATSGPRITTTYPYGYASNIAYTNDNFNKLLSDGGFGQVVPMPTSPIGGVSTSYTPT